MAKYKPSYKAPDVERMLESMFGRTTAINNDMCVKRPYGCGEPIGPFRDLKSQTEYTISGMCQTCQDSVFGRDNDTSPINDMRGEEF